MSPEGILLDITKHIAMALIGFLSPVSQMRLQYQKESCRGRHKPILVNIRNSFIGRIINSFYARDVVLWRPDWARP